MRIAVTDLTRFENRNIVCVAGIDLETGTCVRPLEQGNEYGYLEYNEVRELNVQPGTILSGNFRPRTDASRPHVEDHWYRNDISVVGTSSSEEFEALLEDDAVTTIHAGFGSRPANRVFVEAPRHSIITLRLDNPTEQLHIVGDQFNPQKIKAHIKDESNFNMSFTPITDLGFCDHIDALKRLIRSSRH